jgi:hypothetical protein
MQCYGENYIVQRRNNVVCRNKRVIKSVLIHGRILFKFAVNRLQITTSSMGYILIMFTHRAHACGRACAGARVRARVWFRARLSLDRFFSNLL